MAKKLLKWTWIIAVGAVVIVVLYRFTPAFGDAGRCPGSQVYCPGVGCLSGKDKCVPGAKGGPSVVFSQEPFDNWPGVGVASKPPTYGAVAEGFEMPTAKRTSCPGGTRTDGPCLLQF